MVDYYVDGAVGNDGNLGTSEGAGNAWATVNYGLSQIADGDKLWVKASVTYNEFATIVTAGTLGGGIWLEGYTTTPGDGGKVTMDGTGFSYAMFSSLGAIHYIIENFRFVNANVDGFRAALADNIKFKNCEFNNNLVGGATLDDRITYVNCAFMNNVQYGLTTGADATILGCVMGNNGDNAMYSAGSELIYRTLIYGVPSGKYAVSDNTCERIIGCTFVGETGASRGIFGVLVNAIVLDNIIEGFDTGVFTTGHYLYKFIGYNGMNNTLDYSDTRVDIGYGDVTGSMAFTDKDNDDYTLSGGSPAIDAGIQPGSLP